MKYLTKITVVTPSYNQGKYLRETIESVLNQNYPNLEYFIVDGGSTDNSVDIIREYEDRIDWWISEKDKGQSDAINKGFKKATGTLLCWVNSDDILFPNCLKEIANCYIINKKPDLIHANSVYINQDGIITRMLKVPIQTEFFMFRGVWSTPAPSVFFSASLMRKVGYLDPTLHLSMDLDICMRMMKAGGRVGHVLKYLGAFRWHETSRSSIERSYKKNKSDENHETKKILDAALSVSTECRRKIWRKIWKLYQIVNLNYLRSYLDTKRNREKHWKTVFKRS